MMRLKCVVQDFRFGKLSVEFKHQFVSALYGMSRMRIGPRLKSPHKVNR